MRRELTPGCIQNPVTAHLLLSHTHWDHIQGFPFFVPAYLPSTTIRVYGASRADRTSYQLLTGQMQSDHFPVSFTDLGARIEAREFEGGEVGIGGQRKRDMRGFDGGDAGG